MTTTTTALPPLPASWLWDTSECFTPGTIQSITNPRRFIPGRHNERPEPFAPEWSTADLMRNDTVQGSGGSVFGSTSIAHPTPGQVAEREQLARAGALGIVSGGTGGAVFATATSADHFRTRRGRVAYYGSPVVDGQIVPVRAPMDAVTVSHVNKHPRAVWAAHPATQTTTSERTDAGVVNIPPMLYRHLPSFVPVVALSPAEREVAHERRWCLGCIDRTEHTHLPVTGCPMDCRADHDHDEGPALPILQRAVIDHGHRTQFDTDAAQWVASSPRLKPCTQCGETLPNWNCTNCRTRVRNYRRRITRAAIKRRRAAALDALEARGATVVRRRTRRARRESHAERAARAAALRPDATALAGEV